MFYYVFYWIHITYLKLNIKNEWPQNSSFAFFLMLQGANILMLIAITQLYIFPVMEYLNIAIMLAFVFTIFFIAVLNHYLIIKDDKYKKIIERFKNETDNQFAWRGGAVMIYILLSVLAFAYFGSAVHEQSLQRQANEMEAF